MYVYIGNHDHLDEEMKAVYIYRATSNLHPSKNFFL